MFVSAENFYEVGDRCEKLWEVYGSLSLPFVGGCPVLFSVIFKAFKMVLLNLSYKRHAKVPIMAIYSIIIYFTADLPTPFSVLSYLSNLS